MSERHDREADRIQAHFPAGPRLVTIGSTSFWHADSEATCLILGRLLAEIANLVLIEAAYNEACVRNKLIPTPRAS